MFGPAPSPLTLAHPTHSNIFSHTHIFLTQGTVRESISYFQNLQSNAGAWGKAVATIDASAARVFADRWCQHTHEHGKKHVERQGQDALRKVVQVDSRSMLYANLVRLPSPVSNRVFTTWLTWRKEPDNSFIIAFTPLEDYADESDDAAATTNFMAKQKERRSLEGTTKYADTVERDISALELLLEQRTAKKRHVQGLIDLISGDLLASKAERASVRGFWRIKPLAPSVCQVTYLIQAELRGSIPFALLNARLKNNLGFVQTLQSKFARKGKVVDKEMREAFPNPPALITLSDEQKPVFESCRYLESEEGGGWKTLASPSPLVKIWMKHAPAKENKRSIAIGKATAIIDCSMHEAIGESSGAAESALRTNDMRKVTARAGQVF